MSATDALALSRRARMLDPLRPNGDLGLGYVLLKTGRIDEAIAALRAGLVRLPGNPTAIQSLGEALLAKGQSAEAVRVAAPLAPEPYIRLMIVAIATAVSDRAASGRALAALVRLYSDAAQYQIAPVHAKDIRLNSPLPRSRGPGIRSTPACSDSRSTRCSHRRSSVARPP